MYNILSIVSLNMQDKIVFDIIDADKKGLSIRVNGKSSTSYLFFT